MNKENIISAEYIYDLHGHKGMIKVITNDNEYWVPNECPENKDYLASCRRKKNPKTSV